MTGKSILYFVTLMLTLSGCSGGNRTFPVSGTVTFNGMAIESGSITFDAEDGGPGSFSTGIQNGVYKVRSFPGKKKVSVTAYRAVGDPKAATPNMENYIPSRYNTATTLVVTVEENESNQFDFPLTSE